MSIIAALADMMNVLLKNLTRGLEAATATLVGAWAGYFGGTHGPPEFNALQGAIYGAVAYFAWRAIWILKQWLADPAKA